MRKTFQAVVVGAAILAGELSLRGADLDVPLAEVGDRPPVEMVHRHLMRQVEEAVQQWQADYEKRKTPEEIAAYQKRLREQCLRSIGGLPERTPLNPQVTGGISRPGYAVEKAVFESQPKHYVTALLFLPASERFKPPYPGVLVPCGHFQSAKRTTNISRWALCWRSMGWPRRSSTPSTRASGGNIWAKAAGQSSGASKDTPWSGWLASSWAKIQPVLKSGTA